MKILFICKYNRFRSKIAEALFNKYNNNSKHKAKSAGIIQGSFPLDKYEVKFAKNMGIKLSGKPKPLSTKLLKWQDMVIIVSNEIPKSLFNENTKYGKKLKVWKIKDQFTDKQSDITNRITLIDKKIKSLIKELK
jgi:protein-tyrosine-phosphatase